MELPPALKATCADPNFIGVAPNTLENLTLSRLPPIDT
jgi:hypothetical protein